MSAALAYIDDWTEEANPEPPRVRPRLYLAYSRSEKSNNETSNTTYDTRRKSDKLDFGYGWSVDYQSLQVRKENGDRFIFPLSSIVQNGLSKGSRI